MGRAIEGFDAADTKLYHEPFIGWRGWRWNPQNKRLHSLNTKVWEPGEELHAECTAGGHHKAPDVDCNCGIFSMKDPRWLDNHVSVRNKYTVIGTIKLWGNVVAGSMGYRAEYAMIDALYIPCSDAEVEHLLMMKFMYDIDGDKNPTYLRSLLAKEIEKVYGVTVYKHDPEVDLVVPEWEQDEP